MRQRLVLVFLLCLPAPPALGDTVVASGDASIARGPDGETWTLLAGGATLTLRAGGTADFALLQLRSPSGKHWTVAPASDTSLTVNGHATVFGQAAAGFVFQSATAVTDGPRLRMDAVYDLLPIGLRVTRHYAVTDGSPTFEAWTTIERTGRRSVKVANLNAVALTVPAGTIHYVTGLQGDNADVAHDTAFTLHSRTLNPGEHLSQGAQGRSSEKAMPWFAVDGSPDAFYTTLLWSGAWSFTADRSATDLALAFGLASMTTTVNEQPIDGPHVLFGVVRGGVWNASAALRSYVLQSLRQGRPLAPLASYNTWYAYGTSVDEDSMREAMARAADLGLELFVIDAGWYTGAGAKGRWDFDTGLGTWQPDPARFPNGLAPLRDYAHGLGLKFGVWVEPERVHLNTVGQPGLAQEPWLATRQGQSGSDHSALLCLAGAAGRQWVLTQLTQLMETVHPDYLKWDNNLWINCDRTGHGHGANDGNFAQVTGLYDLLATLRARYPAVLIENAGGGGTRLDLGLVRYTDSAWMDDHTAPSVHVRHNLEGLSALFPPAYLLSFVIESEGEPIHHATDLPLYFRSRMVGGLGLSFKNEGFSDEDLTTMQREIATYRALRDAQAAAAGTMLTAQAEGTSGTGWDAVQEMAADNPRVVLIWAFQSDPTVTRFTAKPTGLTPQIVYQVWSTDAGALGTSTGADLMRKGIDLSSASTSAAHLLMLTVQR